jgi:hypothetical protein
MNRTVVLGLVPSPSDAESAVNNLTEQGVSERSISVITADPSDARAIIDDSGPLRGTTRETVTDHLAALGVTEADAYAAAIDGGQALLAISVSTEMQASAEDTLRSYRAQRLTAVPDGGKR